MTTHEAQIATMQARVADGCDPLTGKPLRYCGGEVRMNEAVATCQKCRRSVVLTDDGDWAHA